MHVRRTEGSKSVRTSSSCCLATLADRFRGVSPAWLVAKSSSRGKSTASRRAQARYLRLPFSGCVTAKCRAAGVQDDRIQISTQNM